MKAKLQYFFSSIGIRLFIGFWLIAFGSVFLTRFILNQFQQDTIITTPQVADVAKLQKLQKRIALKKPSSVKAILKHNHRITNERASIILKAVKNKEIFYSKRRYLRVLSNYLEKNQINNLTTIQFPFARITGPLPVTVANQEYQIFIASRGKSPLFNEYLHQLPTWARIIIPILISLIVCAILARTFSKTLLQIKQRVTAFGEGDLSQRIILKNIKTTEMHQLATSFNQMAEKLSTNINAHQRLLGNVSHELRSPLTRLQLALGLASKQQNNPEKLNEHLVRCQKETKELESMIADVLSLSRHENTVLNIEKHPCDVSFLLQSCIEANDLNCQDKQITVHQNIEKHITVQASEELFKSAFNNILINAIKYTPEISSIFIKAQTINNELIIEIVDQGLGVPEDQLSKLFDAFYRVSEARDRHSGGTGLGLAITKQAIEAHQGAVSAKNVSEGGLCITIKIPLTR